MPQLFQLDQETSDAWDEWKSQQKKQNDADKKARRAKERFEAGFGDRKAAVHVNGERINRVREQRSGYTVPDKTITRYVIEPDGA